MRTKSLSSLLIRKKTETRGYIDYGVKCEYPFAVNKRGKINLVKKSFGETILYSNLKKNIYVIEMCIGHNSDTCISSYITYKISLENLMMYVSEKDMNQIIPTVTNQTLTDDERFYYLTLRYNDNTIDSCYKISEWDFNRKHFQHILGYDGSAEDINWECWELEKLESLLEKQQVTLSTD